MVKPKFFRPWTTEQTLLLPPSPVDWLLENHLVFFLLILAAELDLEAIHAVYRQKDPRGEKADEPSEDGRAVALRLLRGAAELPQDRKWPDGKTRPSVCRPEISSQITAGSVISAGVT
jgi:hypothetical protein